jgi:threonine aldolase
MEGELF